MNVLFVCNLGRNRSRTAAEIFSDRYNTDYAGIYLNPVKKEQLEWADKIVVMEDEQARFIISKYPKQKDKISVLNIKNIFRHDDPELIELLKEKMMSLEWGK